jgi:hypothetical protein
MMLVQHPIMRIFTGMGSPLKAAPARHGIPCRCHKDARL